MNLNAVAKEITEREGGKRSISIAQVKEVLRLALERLAQESDAEIVRTVRRQGRKRSA